MAICKSKEIAHARAQQIMVKQESSTSMAVDVAKGVPTVKKVNYNNSHQDLKFVTNVEPITITTNVQLLGRDAWNVD